MTGKEVARQHRQIFVGNTTLSIYLAKSNISISTTVLSIALSIMSQENNFLDFRGSTYAICTI